MNSIDNFMPIQNSSKLRIGIITESKHVPFWAIKMLKKIEKSKTAEISYLFEDNLPSKKYSSISYRIYKNFYKNSVISPNAFKVENFEEHFPNTKLTKISPVLKENHYFLNNSDLEKITKKNLDIIFSLTPNFFDHKICKIPNLGI